VGLTAQTLGGGGGGRGLRDGGMFEKLASAIVLCGFSSGNTTLVFGFTSGALALAPCWTERLLRSGASGAASS